MRVNVYAEEMTDRIEIISKEIDGHSFTGLRFYLELPATVNGAQYQAPFIHRPGDDDSAAVTFWGKRDLRKILHKAQAMLDAHYGPPQEGSAGTPTDVAETCTPVEQDEQGKLLGFAAYCESAGRSGGLDIGECQIVARKFKQAAAMLKAQAEENARLTRPGYVGALANWVHQYSYRLGRSPVSSDSPADYIEIHVRGLIERAEQAERELEALKAKR